MANPLFQAFSNMNDHTNANAFASLIAEARQMGASFQGDPRAEVQRLLNTGQMSQQQFNEFAQIANQVYSMMR